MTVQISKKIVFTNGCFDILHRGHIEYLQFCKSLGDIVIVGLNSDTSIKQIKGPNRPINNEEDRKAVLLALSSVDKVILFDTLTPIDLIKCVRPDVLVKSEQWAEKGIVGQEFVESYGGKVILASHVPNRSTTSIIKKIREIK